jgi:hypothetical protein
VSSQPLRCRSTTRSSAAMGGLELRQTVWVMQALGSKGLVGF